MVEIPALKRRRVRSRIVIVTMEYSWRYFVRLDTVKYLPT